MNKKNCIKRDARGNFPYWWSLVGMSLFTLMLMGVGSMAQAEKNADIPELPPIEVKPELLMPIPIKTFAPKVSGNWVGTKIRMKFKLGTDGKPYSIRYPMSFNEMELNLGSVMRSYLALWEFEPARDLNGNLVAVELALPVVVVRAGNGNTDRYAGINYSEPVLLAVIDP